LEQKLQHKVQEQQLYIKKLEEAYKTKLAELQNKNTTIQQLQAKIRELTPQKNKNKDFGGIGF
jgi:exonuclease VII large subunit